MNKEAEIVQAEAAALEARARLVRTLAEVQERLDPRNLMNEAWREVRERGDELVDGAVDLARRKPLAVGAILGGIALFVVRRPAARTLSWLAARRRATRAANGGSANEHHAQPRDDGWEGEEETIG
jgi:hypothetical protein